MQSQQHYLNLGTAKQLGSSPAICWSEFNMTSYDRTSEIKIGVREDTV
jgi:hypothetical protein